MKGTGAGRASQQKYPLLVVDNPYKLTEKASKANYLKVVDGKIDFTGYRIYGIDLETVDPHLKTRGPSWVFGEGKILCTAIYDAKTGSKKAYKGCPAFVRDLLMDDHAIVVGANIGYDLGWMEYHFGTQRQTRAHMLDCLFAEAQLDEFADISLEQVAKKWLGVGKNKARIEDWVHSQGHKGDFRLHLEDAPWELLEEYVLDDAELPVLALQQQLLSLEKQNLCAPFLLDCRMIKLVLRMKQHGMRIDRAFKQRSFEELTAVFEKLNNEFISAHGKVNFNSSKQIAELFNRLKINYNVKIKLNGKDGVKYGSNLRQAVDDVSYVIEGFAREKKEVNMYVPKAKAPRIVRLLKEEGFMCSANPSVNAKFRAAIAEDYPVAGEINNIKKVQDTLSRFLGENFDEFITKEGRVHGTFNIAKADDKGTISGRLSGSNPNLQQIQSKGELELEGYTEKLKLAARVRPMFIPDEGCDLGKIDYAQIEYRLLVHYAVGPGANHARDTFLKNKRTDYHQFVIDLTGLDRKPAKNCNFGIMYGMSPRGMQKAFNWKEEFVAHVLDEYHAALPYVTPTMDLVKETAKERGYILTIGGRRARLRGKEYAYTMLNRLNQGGSADIMKKAMVQAEDEGVWDVLEPHLTVHDELVFSIPRTKEGIYETNHLSFIMEHCTPLKIPLLAEPEIGPNWYDVIEVAPVGTVLKAKEGIERDDVEVKELTYVRGKLVYKCVDVAGNKVTIPFEEADENFDKEYAA